MPLKSYRDESKINWGSDFCEQQHPDRDALRFVALLRIADACEAMAQNHQALINDRDLYKRWYEEERKTTTRFVHRIAGLQGYIKRLKKRKSK